MIQEYIADVIVSSLVEAQIIFLCFVYNCFTYITSCLFNQDNFVNKTDRNYFSLLLATVCFAGECSFSRRNPTFLDSSFRNCNLPLI